MESREVAVVEVWLSVVSARLTRPLVRPDNSLWKYIYTQVNGYSLVEGERLTLVGVQCVLAGSRLTSACSISPKGGTGQVYTNCSGND